MKFLITGGAGFIGSHLARHLVSGGHKVVILDNLSSGKLENVRPMVEYGDHWIADCQNTEILRQAAEGCDYIYHCASTVGVTRVLRDPASCIRNIISSTQSVLSLGVPGMYFSTSEVYGKCYWVNNPKLKEDEDINISSAPRWSYAAAKLCGEWLALDEGWQVVRLFNVVGPRQNPAYGAVMPRFVQAALEDKPLEVYGTGEQVRTFTAVLDVVRILDRLRGATADVVNVGGAATISIGELARRVRDILGSKSVIDHVPYEKAYPPGFEETPSRIPDLTKLHQILGPQKYKSLETIIKEMEKQYVTVGR